MTGVLTATNSSLRGVSGANDEAISVRILSLNGIASVATLPRNDGGFDGGFRELNEIASVALLPRNDRNSRNDGDSARFLRSLPSQ